MNFDRMACVECFGAMKPLLVGKHSYTVKEKYNYDDAVLDLENCARMVRNACFLRERPFLRFRLDHYVVRHAHDWEDHRKGGRRLGGAL